MGRGVGSGTKHTWKTALDATTTTDVEGVGAIREEYGPLGYRRFVWSRVVQSAGASSGDVMQYGLRWGGVTVSIIDGVNSQLTVITGGGNVSFVTGTVGTDAEEDALVDDWIVITSTVAAGRAPEGEMRKIKSNTSNKFFVATDFSVAPSVLDNFNIIRPGGVVDATSAGVSGAGGRVAGVLMADIAAFEYGWLQTTGIHTGVTVDTLASSAEGPAILGPGSAEVTSTLVADSQSLNVLPTKVVGTFLTSVQAGLDSLKSPVYLDI